MPPRYSGVLACQISPWAGEEEFSFLAILPLPAQEQWKLSCPVCCWSKWWVGSCSRAVSLGFRVTLWCHVLSRVAGEERGRNTHNWDLWGESSPKWTPVPLQLPIALHTSGRSSWETPFHRHTRIHSLLGSYMDVWGLFILAWVIMPKFLYPFSVREVLPTGFPLREAIPTFAVSIWLKLLWFWGLIILQRSMNTSRVPQVIFSQMWAFTALWQIPARVFAGFLMPVVPVQVPHCEW